MLSQDVKTIRALDNFFSGHKISVVVDQEDLGELISETAESAEPRELTAASAPCMIDSTEKLIDFLGELVDHGKKEVPDERPRD